MNVREQIRSIFAPLGALTFAVILAVVYFGNQEANQSLRDLHVHFYSRFSPGWLHFSEGELHDATLSGRPSDMDQLVVRAALSRWRLREQSPIPFDNVMTWYGEGLWSSPDREAWEQVFEELDGRWREARRDHADGIAGEADIRVEHTPGSVILRFPAASPTSTLGSRLVLSLEGEGPEGVAAEQDFVAYWQTTGAPGRSAFRARRGEVHPLEETAPGRRQMLIIFDFSWEPAWLAPGATVTMIEVFSAALDVGVPLRIHFDDSPLLPIGGAGMQEVDIHDGRMGAP